MRKLLAGVSIWVAVAGAASCGPERAGIILDLRLPQGAKDASAMTVLVSIGSNCDPATGRVTNESAQGDPQSFDLDKGGCSGSAVWCKTIKIDKDGQQRTFHILGKGAGGEFVVEGCSQAVVDKDPLDVGIVGKQYIAPPCCNNGKLEAVEQCDSGNKAMTDCSGKPGPGGKNDCIGAIPDAVCECDCLAKEIVLSIDGTGPATTNNPNTKADLALAFSGATANPMSDFVASSLRAVYTDVEGIGGSDVNLRMLKDTMFPYDGGQFAKQLRMPALCSSLTGAGAQRLQRSPAIARISEEITAVVYADNLNSANPTLFDVSIDAQGSSGCADKDAVQVNATKGSSCDSPDVARGPDGQALVVWNQAGQLRGRIWKSTGDLVPAMADIEIGAISPMGKPHVAGNNGGWMVVYAGSGSGDPDGVFFKTVSTSGAVGAETKVNAVTDGVQDQPDVAMFKDGTALVVWQSGGKILFQRFNGVTPRMGDQDAPLSSKTPAPASAPAVASDDGTWFAAAWQAGDGSIWARYLGKDAFGFNNVSGQNDDFLATHPGIKHARSGPAVAVGTGFVAIGWLDTTMDDPHGMIVRRLPPPRK